ncbi:DUF4178 domain-containing protein [Mariniluteicoccus flavus]
MTAPYLHADAQVAYQGHPVTVVGTIRLTEDGDQWAEHHLVGFPVDLWVSVEGTELVRWTQRPDLAHLSPARRSLDADDTTFRREESGEASYVAEGDTGTGPSGTVEYHDYSSDSGAVLSFERFDGGAWEVSTGRALASGDLTALR